MERQRCASGSYVIYKNGSLCDTGDWTGTGDVRTVDLNPLSLGTFIFTVVFTDKVGNTGTDTVMVTVLMETTTTTTSTGTTTTTETSSTTTTATSTTTTSPLVVLGDTLLLVVGVMLRKRQGG
ncbi:MAG: hypothetical protein KGY80_05935 [Candidatus Thorarchaeota archaeon]|nr:hypothetical protein [Candidatus Thorarchaeota archaeon]